MVVMSILWEMTDGGTVAEVLERYDAPKPAYTTVGTFLKILEKKGFVESRKQAGRSYKYLAIVSKEEYSRRTMQDVKKDLFSGSAKSLLSFLVQEEELSLADIQELMELVRK